MTTSHTFCYQEIYYLSISGTNRAIQRRSTFEDNKMEKSGPPPSYSGPPPSYQGRKYLVVTKQSLIILSCPVRNFFLSCFVFVNLLSFWLYQVIFDIDTFDCRITQIVWNLTKGLKTSILNVTHVKFSLKKHMQCKSNAILKCYRTRLFRVELGSK